MVDECANLGIMAPGGKAVSRLACQVALSQAMNDANEAIELLQVGYRWWAVGWVVGRRWWVVGGE